jgi:hypothetical protein
MSPLRAHPARSWSLCPGARLHARVSIYRSPASNSSLGSWTPWNLRRRGVLSRSSRATKRFTMSKSAPGAITDSALFRLRTALNTVSEFPGSALPRRPQILRMEPGSGSGFLDQIGDGFSGLRWRVAGEQVENQLNVWPRHMVPIRRSRRRAGDRGCEPVSHPPLDRVGHGADELGDLPHSGATPLIPIDQRIVEDRLGGAPGICLAELRDQRAGFGGSGSDSSTGSASIRPHKTAPKTSIRHAASSSRVAVRRPRPRARSRRRRRVAFLTWGRSSRSRRRAHSRSA